MKKLIRGMALGLAACVALTACGSLTSLRLTEPPGAILIVNGKENQFPNDFKIAQREAAYPIEMLLPIPERLHVALQDPEMQELLGRRARIIEEREHDGKKQVYLHLWGTLEVPIVVLNPAEKLYEDKLSVSGDLIESALLDGKIITVEVISAGRRRLARLFAGAREPK